jgi:hypothetical protein
LVVFMHQLAVDANPDDIAGTALENLDHLIVLAIGWKAGSESACPRPLGEI